MLEQEIGNFETKIEQLESKLYRYEDKTLMLVGKFNDKTKAIQDNVATKFIDHHAEQERELTNQKKNISNKIREIEVQLKSKEDEIKQLESRMMEKNKINEEKIVIIEGKTSDENFKANAALKMELNDVKHQIDTTESKIVALIDKSNKKVNKRRRMLASKIKCDNLEKTFSSNTELELHIEKIHIMSEFNCDNCDKVFVSRWRLNMHQKSHTLQNRTRNCHYFNSGKICPFEKLGCKFQHIMSSECKFRMQCTFKMCQFRH